MSECFLKVNFDEGQVFWMLSESFETRVKY